MTRRRTRTRRSPSMATRSTKLAGERAALATLPDDAYVVRTAWLYGAHGTAPRLQRPRPRRLDSARHPSDPGLTRVPAPSPLSSRTAAPTFYRARMLGRPS